MVDSFLNIIIDTQGTAKLRKLERDISRTKRTLEQQRASLAANTERLTGMQRAARGTGLALRVLGVENKRVSSELRRLTSTVIGADNGFNTFRSTITRTLVSVGSLAAAFTGIRAIVEGVKFADQLQQANIQIAGIIAAAGTLVDSTGDILEPADAFNSALALSREQVRGLQQDALRTAATFQELLIAFQTGIAPGLAAGFDLDEIRELTVGISQAATALGVQQNQLAEEIRGLFSGVISTRNTRIATVLQITSADIARVKEAGTQVQFLREKLEGFTKAAALLEGTLLVAFSNSLDALAAVGATALEPFRKTLVVSTDILRDALKTDELRAGLQELGQIFADVTEGAVRFLAELDGNTLKEFAEFGRAVVKELKELARPVLKDLATAFGLTAKFSLFFLKVLTEIIETRAGRFFLGLYVQMQLLGGIVGFLVRILRNLGFVLLFVTRTVYGLITSLGVLKGALLSLGIGAVLVVVGLLAERFLDLSGGVETSNKAFEEASAEFEKAAKELLELEKNAKDAGLVPLAEETEEATEATDNLAESTKKLREELEGLALGTDVDGPTGDFARSFQEFQKLDLEVDTSAFDKATAKVEELEEKVKTLRAVAASGGQDSTTFFDAFSLRNAEKALALARGAAVVEERRLRALKEQRRLDTSENLRLRLELLSKVIERRNKELDIENRRLEAEEKGTAQAAARVDLAEAEDRVAAIREEIAGQAQLNDVTAKGFRSVAAVTALLATRTAKAALLQRELATALRAVAVAQAGVNAAAAEDQAEAEEILQKRRDAAEDLREALDDLRRSQEELEVSTIGLSDAERNALEQENLLGEINEQRGRVLSFTATGDFQGATEGLTVLNRLRAQYNALVERGIDITERDTERTQADADAKREAANEELNARRRRIRAEAQLLAATIDPRRFAGEVRILNIRREQLLVELDQARADKEAARGVAEQEEALANVRDIQAELVELARERAALEDRNPESFAAGLRNGFNSFLDENTFNAIGQRFATALSQGFTGFVGNSLYVTIADAFNPDSNTSLADAFDALQIQLGDAILRAVTNALAEIIVSQIFQLISSLFSGPAQIGGPAGAERNIRRASGGRIPTFDGGGPVGGPNLPKAPRGAPSSDKTLALVTPGEYVIRKASAQALGYDFLSGLNRGKGKAFRAAVNRDYSNLGPLFNRVKSYAAGGVVESLNQARVGSLASDRSGTQVLPVLVASRAQVRPLLRGRGFDESLARRKSTLRGLDEERQ